MATGTASSREKSANSAILHLATGGDFLGLPPAAMAGVLAAVVLAGNACRVGEEASGGSAVLHQGDLTYAVVASGFASSRLKAYQTICEFLIEGWRAMGLDLHYGEAGRGYIHNPNCFGTATGADLVTLDGCKLIGSAQLRRGDAILQHGSMRLQPDVSLFSQVFGEELIPVQLPLSEGGDDLIATVIDVLSAAACRCFEIDLEVQPLSEEEWQAIADVEGRRKKEVRQRIL